MVIPLALAVRFRWAIRLALIGYAADHHPRLGHPGPVLTRPPTSPRRIEVALIVAVAVDFARMDGNPVTVVRRELANFGSFVARVRGTAAAGA